MALADWVLLTAMSVTSPGSRCAIAQAFAILPRTAASGLSANSMLLRYTAAMRSRQSLPLLWILSDARNDGGLEAALERLPAGSGLVFRHYHLGLRARAARFGELAEVARVCGHVVVLADKAALAREWRAAGVYGGAACLMKADGLLRLGTAHDGEELADAAAAGADGVFLSPVFPTRSHPDARPLGIHGFHVLAQRSPVPVIALGGMTAERARELAWPRWGAIDGLVPPHAP